MWRDSNSEDKETILEVNDNRSISELILKEEPLNISLTLDEG